jgi:hypothetical protein
MKYLNAVLTVIATCLVLITLAVTGLIPTANAKETKSSTVTIPLNPDGSINVKLSNQNIIDVNIEEVDGHSLDDAVPVVFQKKD